MTKLSLHIVTLIVLLLAASPWLQPTQVIAAEETPTCCCCKTEATAGCCSKSASSEEPASNESPTDGCGCKMTDIPAVPATPVDLTENRTDNKSFDSMIEQTMLAQTESILNPHNSESRKSPPRILTRPTYVLFSSLLI